MRLRGLTVTALGIAFLWPAAAGAQQSGQGVAQVNAEGNVFTGGLRFNPAAVSVRVGDIVRWTNTDALVPHTATEDHGLWNLTGTYGATPSTPPGFGPGESRERVFAAGAWSYFCEVHPTTMRGTVDVPVVLSDLAAKRKKRKQRTSIASAAKKAPRKRFKVLAVWATEELPQGQVFDVHARRGHGPWKSLVAGKRILQVTFPGGPRGTRWAVRARVRGANDPDRSSGYSPEATLTVG